MVDTNINQTPSFSDFLQQLGLTYVPVELEGIVDQPERFMGAVETPDGTTLLFMSTQANDKASVLQAIGGITQLISGVSEEVKHQGLIFVNIVKGMELITAIGAAMSDNEGLNRQVRQQLVAVGAGNVLLTVVNTDTSSKFAQIVLTGSAQAFNRINLGTRDRGEIALATDQTLSGTLPSLIERVEKHRRDQ